MEAKDKFYNYKITNLVNGKIYIGKCSNPKERWKSHLRMVAHGKQDDHNRYQYIHRAINKHGVENFLYEIIDEFNTEQEALDSEVKYIALYNSKDRDKGYNLTNGGDGASGYRFSDEQKTEMSRKRKGKYIGKNNPFYGKTHTDETKKIISDKHKEAYVGSGNPFSGKTHTEESLNKMKANHYNKKKFLTDEQISEIRTKYKTRNYTYQEIADEYNVSHAVIVNICLYKKAYLKDKPKDYSFKNIHTRVLRETADEIRAKYKSGICNQYHLSDEYNIGIRTINAIINFRGTYYSDKFETQAKTKLKNKIIIKPKVSEHDCDKIRKLYLTNDYTSQELADKFNISASTARSIINYKGAYSKKKVVREGVEPSILSAQHFEC